MERGSKRKRLRAPSPAMVVACIALAVTLSGVSYAAATLAKNSVGTAQLKSNAVNSAKVANNSLTGSDINESTLAGGSITGVNAALLGGHPASDFELASAGGGSDAYVVSGGAWNDRDGLMLNAVQATYTGASGSKTQWCMTPGAGTPAAYADIHLPQGAQVTQMTVDYKDDAGTTGTNGTVVMSRAPLFNSDASGTAGDLATVTLGNIGLGDAAVALDNTIGDLNPSLGTIDNSRFSYVIVANPGANTGVGYCAVEINYDLP